MGGISQWITDSPRLKTKFEELLSRSNLSTFVACIPGSQIEGREFTFDAASFYPQRSI